MPLFLDACAFVKRYLDEGVSTERMQDISGRFKDWGGFVVSGFVEPEMVAAFTKHARQKSSGTLHARSRRAHAKVLAAFRQDFASDAFSVVPLSRTVASEAAILLEAHPEYTIGGGDAVHLATAIAVRPVVNGPLVFVTADQALEKAAKAQGFDTLNPLHHGPEALEALFGTTHQA
ncbi:MAG TPA: type II toxin-antitoxin system VapC family toxin [Longimicrobiaceae bacterium]|nr:type II toxin-antitoxin system VapC family toxin [Longimicrobiaceae bacterium]